MNYRKLNNIDWKMKKVLFFKTGTICPLGPYVTQSF